jgi:membrane protease YdiL (CAAX protease family)
MEKIRPGKAVLKIVIAFLLTALVLGIAGVMTELLGRFLQATQLEDIPKSFITHSSMLLMSLVLILIINRWRLKNYGFKLPKNSNWRMVTLLGLAGGVVASITLSLMPGENLPANGRFVEMVVFIWIYASISEEVLFRGLIQGYLQPLHGYSFKLFGKSISLPVFVCAVLFGSIHFNPLIAAMGSARMLTIVFFAFILGIIAGYYRERTGSLIQPILVHALFNIGGTLMEYGLAYII